MLGRKQLTYLSIGLSGATLVLLGWQTAKFPPPPEAILPAILLGLLIIFTNLFAVTLGPGRVSLLPMTTVAAVLVVGTVAAGWAAFLGSITYIYLRHAFGERIGIPRRSELMGPTGLAAANASMQCLGVLLGGAAYSAAGGQLPLQWTGMRVLWPVTALSLSYLIENHLVAGALIALRGRRAWHSYWSSLPNLILYELPPIAFAPLMALVYLELGAASGLALAAALVTASLVVFDLAQARQRLERRVKELDSLQAVGQALSAGLDLQTTLRAIYSQTAALMPARNFFVALYDIGSDEVSFPIAIQEGRRVSWDSRRAGSGLTEAILRSTSPLLIQQEMDAMLDRLGIDRIGSPANSFLGVPILAGERPLGVIAVQSEQEGRYDAGHQAVLTTIAAQASVAIQNARLYESTDEALSRRVHELDSILRTTQEGILLLDRDWSILAANRAMAEFMAVAQHDLTGRLGEARAGDRSFLELIGYSQEALETDCATLVTGQTTVIKDQLTQAQPPGKVLERTLVPVRDQTHTIAGWLMVFRDLTEETELAQLRDDLTHMVVHDLRTPLAVLQGSLEMVGEMMEGGNIPAALRLVGLAQQGNLRVLDLVNGLLELNELESGQMILYRDTVVVADLLAMTAERLAPLVEDAHIEVQIDAAADTPDLHVDPNLIGRAMYNLLDNAIKFTPDGGRVRMWAKQAAEGGLPGVAMGVTDSGPGVPRAVQAHIFEKFRRGTDLQGRRKGSGLGLALCKLAIEAHQGKIWVSSVPGRGSTFAMWLPLQRHDTWEGLDPAQGG